MFTCHLCPGAIVALFYYFVAPRRGIKVYFEKQLKQKTKVDIPHFIYPRTVRET